MLSARRLARRVRARWRTGGRDAGVTLVELLVTMGITSIVGALALGWLLDAGAATDRTTDASISTAGARTVLQSWSDLLRVAGSPTAPGTSAGRFVSIDANSVTFNANLAALPACTTGACTFAGTSQVTLALRPATLGGVATRQLVQTITRGGVPVTSVVVRTGAGLAANTPCLVTPYTAAGAALPCDATTRLDSIARLDLAFAVTPTGGVAQTFQTSVVVTGTTA